MQKCVAANLFFAQFRSSKLELVTTLRKLKNEMKAKKISKQKF